MDEIKKLEEKLLEPLIRKSRTALESLLSDEFIEFSSSGGIYNKTQIIEALLIEENVLYTLKDFNTKLLSEHVVLATYLCLKNDGSNVIKSIRSSIWKKSDNAEWTMHFHQGTTIR